MRDRYWWAPLLGVLFIAVAIASFIIAGEDPPDLDEGAQAAVDYYVEDKDSIVAGSLVQGVATILFLFFVGVVRSRLRETEVRGTLSAVAFAGGIVFATGLAVDATINFAAAEAAEDVDPATIHTLAALWHNDWIPFAVGGLTFVLATGLAIVRFGAVAKWLGYAGILLALIMLTPLGEAGFFGIALYIIVLSVLLALRDRNAPPGTPAAPTASGPAV